MSIDPMRESVGIRQVRSNGVKLKGAMALDVIGGVIASTEGEDGVQVYRLDLSAVETHQADIASLETRVYDLEHGGRWAMPPTHVIEGDDEVIALEIGQFHRINSEVLGSSEGCTCTLPLATNTNKGRRIGIGEISNVTIGPSDVHINIVTTGGQSIEYNRTPPLSLVGSRPAVVLICVEIVTDTEYGWTVES